MEETPLSNSIDDNNKVNANDIDMFVANQFLAPIACYVECPYMPTEELNNLYDNVESLLPQHQLDIKNISDMELTASSNFNSQLDASTGRKPRILFKCSFCPKEFDASWNRNVHQRGHLMQEKIEFKCPETTCGRVYYKKPSLLYHQRTKGHHDWKFRCINCNKAFQKYYMLMRHINCQTCVKRFILYKK
ncbi:zinc finger protein 572-like [Scaptodrosophila lebanonensis]|uniref:Zinc finger protein 572-like n=1 Tax=Drosophila lebanonensis TaxID=7225 RepID=A0A6J2T244_DROLE|nr:zinc finger protein 572-like [Scaptodrosophila lebanonensis]